MCECLGYIGASTENRCEGCREWRQKYRVEIGRPCNENISKTARKTGTQVCAYCWQARAGEYSWQARAGEYSPRSQASAHSGRSTPVQTSQLHTPPPPPWDHVCARMEVMLGRMEGVLGLLVSQTQAAQAAALAAEASPPRIAAQPMQVDLGAPPTATAPPTAGAPPTATAPLLVQAQPAAVFAEVINVCQDTHPTHKATSIPPLTPAPIRITITI